MDDIAGMTPASEFYFAYGSLLHGAELLKTAPRAQPHGRAFLPRCRVVFTKHSDSNRWNGDVATIVPDDTRVVWGFVYRVLVEDRGLLKKREAGYKDVPKTVYLCPPTSASEPSPIPAFTFEANDACPNKCGPPAKYLDVIINGANERELPQPYIQELVSLRAMQTT